MAVAVAVEAAAVPVLRLEPQRPFLQHPVLLRRLNRQRVAEAAMPRKAAARRLRDGAVLM